jgi:hypothetical protein
MIKPCVLVFPFVSNLLFLSYLLKHLRENEALWRMYLLLSLTLVEPKMFCKYMQIERFISWEIKMAHSR